MAAERRGLSVCSSSTEGTSACLQASGEAPGRSGRSTFPSQSLSTTPHMHQYSHLQVSPLSVRKNSDARPGSPPFQDQVDVAGATAGDAPALSFWHGPRKPVNREFHALKGNTASSALAPILPVQGSDSARPTLRTRISRKRTLRGRCGDMRRNIQWQTGRFRIASWCWDFYFSPQGSVSVSGGTESWRSLPRHRRERPMSILPAVPHEQIDRSSVPACAPLSWRGASLHTQRYQATACDHINVSVRFAPRQTPG